MTRRKKIITTSVIVLITIGLASWGPIMSNVEKPDYIVTLTEKNIEIREYSPMITASVGVSGERKEPVRPVRAVRSPAAEIRAAGCSLLELSL